jgi:F-type H+-transporting ATPase subunit b
VIQVDYSLLLQIINFVSLIFILNFLLYKPILAVTDKRRRRLEESEEEINRINRSVSDKMAAYEEKVRSTRIEALERNKERIKEGSEQAKSIVAEVNREISLITEEFQGKIQREVHVAREFLTNQSRSLSVEIAERMLGRRIP